MSEDLNMDLTYAEVMRLIYAFRKHPHLWNPHVYGFHSKESKEESWKIIASECGIHPVVIKKKMRYLMKSCRREKVKLVTSRESGDPSKYLQPTWRYWNAFKFLRGLEDDEEDPLGTAPEMDILEPSVFPGLGKTEYKSMGDKVTVKLRKMYYTQRTIAEHLINQVLFKGTMNKLTKHSKVRSPDDFVNPDKMIIPTSSSLPSAHAITCASTSETLPEYNAGDIECESSSTIYQEKDPLDTSDCVKAEYNYSMMDSVNF